MTFYGVYFVLMLEYFFWSVYATVHKLVFVVFMKMHNLGNLYDKSSFNVQSQ